VDLEMERPAAGVGTERHLGGHQASADDAEPPEDESTRGDIAASIDPLEDDALRGVDGGASRRGQARFPKMGNNRQRRRRGKGGLARGEARTRILACGR
jgi:hypothetical protein